MGDTKVGNIVEGEDDYQRLQQELDMWQVDRGMINEFNADKCGMLYFEKSNQGRAFIANGWALSMS